jgi:hypothetical protein
MATYKVVDPFIGNPTPVTATATAPQFPLGVVVRAQDQNTGTSNVGAGMFQYCQGSNVTAAGQFVHVSGNQAVLLAAANSASKFPVGVAAGNLSATNVYGWVQVQGICDYARGTNSAIAAGVPLYIAAGTAGLLLTNAVAGNLVLGVVAPNSYTSSQSASLTVQLNFPQVIGVTAGI